MPFIANLFRKIKTKIIQMLKGETVIQIVDEDGNLLGEITGYWVGGVPDRIIIRRGAGQGGISLFNGYVDIYDGAGGQLRIDNSYNLIKPHLYPWYDDSYGWGSVTKRIKSMYIGTGGFTVDSKVTMNADIPTNQKIYVGISTDPNTEGVTGSEGDIINYKDTGGNVKRYIYDGTTWKSVGVSDHGELTGLADDDHTQYLLVNGTRAMTGDLDTGGNKVKSGTDWYILLGIGSLLFGKSGIDRFTMSLDQFRSLSDNYADLGLSFYRWKRIYGVDIYGDGKLTLSGTYPLNIPAQSTVPTSPVADDIYLDDGTNTADGNPHLRYYDGTTWHDL